MGDLLRQGGQWLEQMRRAHCSSPVTYRRPGGTGGPVEVELPATLGRTEYEVEDEYGVRIAAHSTDFLVSAEDFTPTFGTPEAGDQVIADGTVYEVMSLAGQGHWRWSDPTRRTLRIHAKETGSGPVTT